MEEEERDGALYGVPDPYFYGRDDRAPKFDLDEDGYINQGDILSHLAKLDGGGAKEYDALRAPRSPPSAFSAI